ncbi:MAG: hypothetical protein ACK4UY_00190 [Dietzia sp.]
MDNVDPIIWIIIGVVAVVVIIALIALTARNNSRKKLSEAAELRKDAREREQQLERQHSVAREQEHRAGAAEQEAKAKAAEADRLRSEADQHRSVVDEQRQDVRRMEEHADKLDPRHRADAPGQTADRGVGADDTARADGLTGGTAGDAGGRHSRSDEAPGVGAHGTGGAAVGDRGAVVDEPGLDDRPVGEHQAARHPEDVDPAARPHEEPGMVDKVLGRTHRDEPGR